MSATSDDECVLAERIASGDRGARDALLCRHAGLVRGCARRYRGEDYMDAVGDGLLALVQAANAYRPGAGPFESVASRAVQSAMRVGHRRRQRARALPIETARDLPDSERTTCEDVTVCHAMATVLTEKERRAVRRAHRLPGERSSSFDGRLLRKAEAKLRRAIVATKEGQDV